MHFAKTNFQEIEQFTVIWSKFQIDYLSKSCLQAKCSNMCYCVVPNTKKCNETKQGNEIVRENTIKPKCYRFSLLVTSSPGLSEATWKQTLLMQSAVCIYIFAMCLYRSIYSVCISIAFFLFLFRSYFIFNSFFLSSVLAKYTAELQEIFL